MKVFLIVIGILLLLYWLLDKAVNWKGWRE
jgi:hypothetical protein